MTGTIALLAAVRQEIAPCAALLSLRHSNNRYSGYVAGRRVVAMTSGLGEARALQAFEKLMADEQPARLVHLGFAGALDPGLRVGDVPEFSKVTNESGRQVKIRGDHPTPVRAAVDDGRTLLTVQQVVGSATTKRRLFERYGACAVDMETYAVARRAVETALPLTVMRAISDEVDTDVPDVAQTWVNADGSTDLIAATRCLAVRPWLIRRMFRLKHGCDLAAGCLAKRVAILIAAIS